MDTTPKPESLSENEVLLSEPEKPEDWECCGSECGDACIQTLYYNAKAAYDAQQRRLKALREAQAQQPEE